HQSADHDMRAARDRRERERLRRRRADQIENRASATVGRFDDLLRGVFSIAVDREQRTRIECSFPLARVHVDDNGAHTALRTQNRDRRETETAGADDDERRVMYTRAEFLERAER